MKALIPIKATDEMPDKDGIYFAEYVTGGRCIYIELHDSKGIDHSYLLKLPSGIIFKDKISKNKFTWYKEVEVFTNEDMCKSIDLICSALSIAEREGRATNWEAFRKQCLETIIKSI